jgi:iron complex transport system substrate-binding protein
LFVTGIVLSWLLLRFEQPARQVTMIGPNTGRARFTTPPQRIICLAPNITESVFALGAGDRVVGISDYCRYPVQALSKPRVGGIVAPNLERVLSLEPDLILAQEPNAKVSEFCRQRNIPFLALQMHDLDRIARGLTDLGRILGREQAALKLTAFLDAELEKLRLNQPTRRPRVLICVGRTPGSLTGIYSVGKNDFLAQLLDIAGGNNIFADTERLYPLISKEAVVKRQPEIIIDTFPGVDMNASRKEQLIRDWQALPNLPAVANHRVYILTDDYLQTPGPRLHLVARRFAELCGTVKQ